MAAQERETEETIYIVKLKLLQMKEQYCMTKPSIWKPYRTYKMFSLKSWEIKKKLG